MAKIKMPYVAPRPQADGSYRPRFVPGPRERAMGYTGKDLKHDDGRWFSLEEALGFANAKRDEIIGQRKAGRKLRTPPVQRARRVCDLWDAYTRSPQWLGDARLKIDGLRASTRKSYTAWLRPVMSEPIWQAPIASLDPVILKALYEHLCQLRTASMARGALTVIQAMLEWGRLRGWLPKIHGQTVENPARRLDMETPPVRLRVASETELTALITASDLVEFNGVPLSAVGDAIAAGFYSGQRKGDVLAFIPGAASNNRIELVQSKTGARVSIPMAPRLVDRLAAGRARRVRRDYAVTSANIVINEGTGLPYHTRTFRDHFQMVRDAAIAGIVDEAATAVARAQHAAEQRNDEPPTIWLLPPCKSLAAPEGTGFTFPDLRDTSVTWYARAGCTVPEIASITGHSLKSIYDILKHYLALDGHLADSAVRKLVDYMEREGMAV
ncbi:hypothetical protein [Tardiphaga sp.]|jgi:integrase|uniref:hypothetical protein n=1 Tax=Tardiphaga sp. TaxID=1926292 RepID=UPI0037D9CAA4